MLDMSKLSKAAASLSTDYRKFRRVKYEKEGFGNWKPGTHERVCVAASYNR